MITTELLTELLKQAKDAHVHYESVTGRADDDWPRWYADYIVGKLEVTALLGRNPTTPPPGEVSGLALSLLQERTPPRFMIASDNSSHRYVIPVQKRDEWGDFVDTRSADVPGWAKRIAGGWVTFTDWRIE